MNESQVIALPAAPPPRVVVTVADVLHSAMQQGASVEVLTKLLDMRARQAFNAAMAEAKATIKPIVKAQHVGFDSKKAGAARTDYDYEGLDDIALAIDPIIAPLGLSYRWRTASVPGQLVTVTCIVSHADGYSEENSLSAAPDHSGNKNEIQAMGSTVTYLQRYTLKPAFGLSATKRDDDGVAAGAGMDTVTGDQLTRLRAAIVRVGIDIAKVLVFAKVERLEEIPARQFEHVLGAVGRWKPKAPPVPEDMSDMPDLPANLDRRGQPAPTVIPNARASR